MIEKSLLMSFVNEEGKKASIRLEGVRDDLDSQEIEAVMNAVISKNIFKTNGGDMKEKHSAQIIAKEVEMLEF